MWKFQFSKLSTEDVYLIQPTVFWDDRGFFMETYSEKEFKQNWILSTFVQENHSKSKKGVFRGFHFQLQHPQAKLVRVIHWAVLDIIIDLRKKSPTYWKVEKIVLSAENKKQFFVPRGFGHGFLTLEDDTEFVYKCDDFYFPEYESGIIYNDPIFWIDRNWIRLEYGLEELLISEKDRKHWSFASFESPF